MKRFFEDFAKSTFLTLIIVFFSMLSFSATYFLSPTGNDTTGDGTINSPWFTLVKAWSVVSAGDIVYLRGGTYVYVKGQGLTGKNGTATNTIKIYAYQDEKPVITRSGSFSSPAWGLSLVHIDGDYIHVNGMEIKNFKDPSGALMWTGITIRNAANNIIERVNSHHNGRGMLVMEGCANNLILNCDFHENYDPSNNYGNGDGFEINNTLVGTTNTIRGCRFYYNADDGLDMWDSDGFINVDNCWSWGNGYRENKTTTGGDGNGFKFGVTLNLNGTTFSRSITNCLSFLNRARGFDQNGGNCKMYVYNNTSYHNGTYGFAFSQYDLPNVFRNNVSFSNNSANWTGTHGNCVIDHNSYDASWQPSGPVASSVDFISIDTTGVTGSRQANGDLPDLIFLKLAGGSDLIDKGTNVGISYLGSSPDLGAYESGTGTTVQVALYNVTGGGSYCIGSSGVSVGLSNTQTGVNYQLRLGGVNTGNAVAGTGSAINFGNKTVAGTYTVVATLVSTSSGVNMTGSAIVSVNPLPVVTFTGGVTPVNAGSTGNVYTTQAGMSNYRWIVSAGGTITSGGGTSNNAVTVTWNTAGAQSISVNYTNGNGCTALSATNYPVTVNALSTGYNVTGGGSYCIGSSGVAVGLSNSQTGVNYQLQLGGVNTGNAVAGTGSAINFGNKTVAGIYTVVATNVSTASTANMTGSATVTVNPLPIVTFTGGVTPVNAGSTGNIYTTQSGMSNYIWIVSAGGIVTSGGGTSDNAVTVTWNTAGAQSVSVNYTNGTGCTASSATIYPVAVNALALPTAYNVIGGGSYFSGESGVEVGLSNSQSGVNYQLKMGGVNNGSAKSGSGSALSYGNKTVAGIYTVTATNVSTASTANMTGNATVTINPLPIVTFSGGTTPVYAGSTGNVYTTQAGMSNYIWNVSAGGTINSGGGSSNNTVTVTWNTAGTQNISVNYTNGSVSASSATNYPVTVIALPTAYNVTGGGSYCSGGTGVAVGLSNSQRGVNYQLKSGGVNTGNAVAGTGSAINFGNKTVAGIYTVVATNVSTASTANMTGSATVTVNPLPIVTFTGGVTPVNAGSTGNVYTTQAGMSNYIWIVSAGGTITSGGGSSNNTVTVTWNTAGAQSISVNYTNGNGCTASSATNYPVTVNVIPSTYLGYNLEGVSSDASGKGDMNASLFTAGSNFTASTMYFSMPNSVIGKIKGAIYSDNNGNPGSKLGETSEIINPTAGGFLKLTGLNVSITSGTNYWLVIWCNASYKVECETTGGIFKWKAHQRYGAWPSKFPNPDGSGGLKYSIYVDGGLKGAIINDPIVSESLSTGIKNYSENVKIDIFPNPSKGRITVRFSDLPDHGSRIDILDISGRKITSRLISGTSEEFNLDQLPAGLYLVKSIIGSDEIIQKLILSK